MNEENITIFVEDMTSLNGTWVVSGLHYLKASNDEETPLDLDLSEEFETKEAAIEFAELTARSYAPIHTLLLLDGSEVELV